MRKRNYGFVRRFCGERGDVHEGWSAPYISGKGAAVLADGLKGAVGSGLGNILYLN